MSLYYSGYRTARMSGVSAAAASLWAQHLAPLPAEPGSAHYARIDRLVARRNVNRAHVMYWHFRTQGLAPRDAWYRAYSRTREMYRAEARDGEDDYMTPAQRAEYA